MGAQAGELLLLLCVAFYITLLAESIELGQDGFPAGFSFSNGWNPLKRANDWREMRTPVFDISKIGGVGDGQTKNTEVIDAAIAKIEQAGQGTLYFPAGVWLTAPFNLTSHITVYVDAGATLLASTDVADWPVIPFLPSYGQGRDKPGPRFTSFLHGEQLQDVIITGNGGVIDGQGSFWWPQVDTLPYTRGKLIELMYSSDITISHLHLKDSPFWTVHPYACDRVFATDLVITAVYSSKNTDGFDPDSSTNVLIQNSYISTGDDAIAIKSGWDQAGIDFGKPTANVLIRNMTLSSIDAAAICVGSEMSGGVTNVYAHNITAAITSTAVHIKSARGRGGFVTNMTVADMLANSGGTALEINDFYGAHPHGKPVNNSAVPIIDSISFVNFTSHGVWKRGVDFEGLNDSTITNVYLENVDLGNIVVESETCSNVKGTYRNVSPKPCSLLTPLD